MTTDEINIAIAESCGWHPHPDNDKRIQKFWTYEGTGYGLPVGKPKMTAAMPEILDDGESMHFGTSPLPDYCNDLNAMHKAELALWHDECLVEKYEEILRNEYLHEVGYQGCSYWFMAGASIRARAFLKTIGKWKD